MRVSGEKNVNSNAASLAAGAGGNNQDNHEKSLLRKISDAQKNLKAVEENQKLSAEEKDKEKKELQNQIQMLNSELQQYRVRKDQEKAETGEKQDVGEEEETLSGDAAAKPSAGERDMGVFVSLEATRDRMSTIQKIRTDLEGRQRTAETEEEKEDLQKKINNLSGRMSLEIRELGETIDGHNAGKADSDRAEKKEKQQKPGEIFGESDREKEKEDRLRGEGKAPDKIFRDIRIQV